MHEGHRGRMREKLFSADEAMTDCELLEMFLYARIGRRNTNPIAHRLLDAFGDLSCVFSATPRMLMAVEGIGPETAEHIYLAGRLLRRLQSASEERVRLYNFYELKRFAAARFAGVGSEKLEFYLTDRNGNLMCTHTLTDVLPDRVGEELTVLARFIASQRPANVIAAHNHPSGSVLPSAQDDEAVAELWKLCAGLGVRLCDCVIVAGGEVYSYYRSGRFEEVLSR